MNKMGQSSLSFKFSRSTRVTDNKRLVNYVKSWKMIKARGKIKQERNGEGHNFMHAKTGRSDPKKPGLLVRKLKLREVQ